MSDVMASEKLTFVCTSGSRPAVKPGTVKEVAGFKYRFVQNSATVTATSGYPAVYVDSAPQDADFDVTVDVTAGAAEGIFAGIVMADMEPSEYGWIIIDGIYETCTVGQTVTAGNAVIVDTGSADGQFDPAGANDILAVCGVAMAEVATATAGPIWIKGL